MAEKQKTPLISTVPLPVSNLSVLLCVGAGQLVALHGFIKKTQKISADDLNLARRRQKEIDE